MKGKILFLLCVSSFQLFAQNDTTGNRKDTTVASTPATTNKKSKLTNTETSAVFNGQRLINTKTVEILRKGVMAFTVIHTFGNIAGDRGGTKNFFGIDEVSDAQIGFQFGLGKHLNVALQHTVGGGSGIFHFYEAGIKYQFMNQEKKAPFSLTAYGNIVTSAQKATFLDSLENSFRTGSDRLSEFIQLMIARKFGSVSLQLSGSYLYTHLVIPGDQNSLFSIGAAMRVPLSRRVFVISDYFHSFRNQESFDTWKNLGFTPRDVFGIGVEIVTYGHVFHINFTNARNILENRFLAHTSDAWGKGEFRWGFTLTRNFMIFRPKESK